MAGHESLTRNLGLPLGNATAYPTTLSPQLLCAVPRALARQELQIDERCLPFSGVDVWTAYELSWLNLHGKPVVALGEFVIPCQSAALPESKSFKLFLNSLNQERLAGHAQVAEIIRDHLSRLVGAPVDVRVIPLEQVAGTTISRFDGMLIDEHDIDIEDYVYRPELLCVSGHEVVEESLTSDLLKSNCLITNQPDWGSVLIRYRGRKIDEQALLRYLVSFRTHNEFHEQCVERIFMDLQRFCQPEKLSVYARYTRRGGLDINPFRSNFENVPPQQRLARQ